MAEVKIEKVDNAEVIHIKVEPTIDAEGITDPVKIEPPPSPVAYENGNILEENRTDKSEWVYCCDHCLKFFPDPITLKKHIETTPECNKDINYDVGDDGNDSFPVENDYIEAELFSNKSSLIMPVKKRTHFCHMCDKSFSQKGHLSAHYRTHTGEKPFECDICYKSFSENCNLARHKRLMHSIQKRYICETCSMEFSEKCSLVDHTQVHTGWKPYSCDLCTKAYVKKSNLVAHRRKHTEEKPYSCGVCNKSFDRIDQLFHHKQKHKVDTRVHTCEVCDKTFVRKRSLVNHKKTHT